MRWIFILLLALNVVYFGWELDRETAIRHKQSPPALPLSAPRLQLISEMAAPPQPRSFESSNDDIVTPPVEIAELPPDNGLVAELPDIELTDTAPIIATYTCYRFGPVLDEALLTSLQDWFSARNTLTRTHFIEDQGKQLFWIYLAPQPSRENAMAVLAEMQRKGVGDFRLINRGDLQNAISLGLFSSREAVNARLQELKEKGFVPVVVPYANVKRIYSLDVRIADSSGLVGEVRTGLPSRFESVPLDCAQISAAEYSP